MSENDKENGKNGNGLFQKGGTGGPGRGNKKDKYPEADNLNAYKDLMEPKVRRVIAGMVDSSDSKERTEGAKLYCRLFDISTEDHQRGVLDPVVLEIVKNHFFGTEPAESSPTNTA